MDIDIEQFVRNELDSSKELLWQGQPIVKVFTARSTIHSIEKTEYSDGSGDLVFAKEQYTTSGDNHIGEVRTRDIGFHSIPSVNEVHKVLKAAVRKDDV